MFKRVDIYVETKHRRLAHFTNVKVKELSNYFVIIKSVASVFGEDVFIVVK